MSNDDYTGHEPVTWNDTYTMAFVLSGYVSLLILEGFMLSFLL